MINPGRWLKERAAVKTLALLSCRKTILRSKSSFTADDPNVYEDPLAIASRLVVLSRPVEKNLQIAKKPFKWLMANFSKPETPSLSPEKERIATKSSMACIYPGDAAIAERYLYQRNKARNFLELFIISDKHQSFRPSPPLIHICLQHFLRICFQDSKLSTKRPALLS